MRLDIEFPRARPEQLSHAPFAAPAGHELQLGRARNISGDQMKDLSETPFRPPIHEADSPVRPADAQQLGSRLLLIGSEHDSDRRKHHIKGTIWKWERLRIAEQKFCS